jgi:SAM-dependent methyltransferase
VSWDTVAPYHLGFREFSQAFEAYGFEEIHKGAIPFLPTQPGLMLDVGAGSGRDAAWFSRHGWDVIAAEPADALRAEAARLHDSPGIRWINDSLPALGHVHRLGLNFDLIWLSGVWMHVPPNDRARAMRRLAMSLKPGGRLVMTLRHGPAPEDRLMWPVDAHEVERLGLDVGLALRVATERADDANDRETIKWQTVILDLPDDGAGALPLLRGVILRQEKSSTYKLALLRCIARIADSSANAAREHGDHVELPLGLVALYWIRMFKPLIARAWPQRPGETLAFAAAGSYALPGIAPYDLRPGARFPGDQAEALRKALVHAARLITDMPARNLTYADDAPVFETQYGRAPAKGATLAIDHDLLWRLGTTRVPLAVWNVLRRMSAWIEPMLIAEWARMMRGYAVRLGETKRTDDAIEALNWIEPMRDTGFVRDLVRQKRASGTLIRCVWSGRVLAEAAPHIDHCLPWAAWPCNDLWNLLPATQSLNLEKSDRLVTGAALLEAKPLIVEWWQQAYLDGTEPVKARFTEEATFSLPVRQGAAMNLEDLFAAVDFRRLRLRQDTQAPEWPRTGPGRKSAQPRNVRP